MKLKGANFSDREKTVLLAGLFCILIVAFYLYMYQPTMQLVNNLQVQLDETQAKLSEVRRISSNPAEFEAQMEANKEEIRTVEDKVPTGENGTEFIRQVEETAKAANVKLVSFKPGEIVDRGSYNVFPYFVEVKGQYHDTITYLNLIESLPRLVNITGWKVVKNESGIINATYYVEVYGTKGKAPVINKDLPAQNRNPFI